MSLTWTTCALFVVIQVQDKTKLLWSHHLYIEWDSIYIALYTVYSAMGSQEEACAQCMLGKKMAAPMPAIDRDIVFS